METPIQKIITNQMNNVNIYCKREDLIPFSLGGNKVRIASEFYKDMIKKQKDCMVVYGNSRSNLCRVLANICCSNNTPCYMICSNEEHEENTLETNNSKLMKWLGAKVIPCRKDEIAKTVETTLEQLEKDGYKPYYIFGDKYGEGNEGTPVQAYVDAYKEIREFEKRENVPFSHIFFASGTGSTQCGLISGKLLNEGNEKIVGISISSREYERAISIIEEGIRQYFKKIETTLPNDFVKEIILETAYRKGGYGLYDMEVMDIIKEQFIINGIPLDPTYTGKAFWGMKQYLKEHAITEGNVLFMHTGGTPLFYDCL